MREIKKMKCLDCEKDLKCERETKSTNHLFHLILVITLSFIRPFISYIWIVIWILSSIKFNNKFNCSVCGSTNLELLKKDKLKRNIKLGIYGIFLIIYMILIKDMDSNLDLFKSNNPQEIKKPLTKKELKIEKQKQERILKLQKENKKKREELKIKKQKDFLENIKKNNITKKSFSFLNEEEKIVMYEYRKNGNLIIYMDKRKYENMDGYRDYIFLTLNSEKMVDYVDNIVIYSSRKGIEKVIGFNSNNNNKFLK